MSTVLVREALPSEYDAVAELTLDVYVGGGFINPADDYVDDLRDTARRAAQAEVWVAVEDDRLLGAVTYCPAGSPWRELAADGEGEFRMLAVAPAGRGRGVGTALVRRCLERAREAGCTGVVISTMAQMADAHRLYGQLGFRPVPDQDWSPVRGVCLKAFRLEL